jgi:DNA-binding response OmpR family regulator
VFTESGHTVFEAANGAEAWEWIRNGMRPDVLITDMAMPKMNGEDLARRVRALVPSMPIILISGLADYVEHTELYNLIIQKPFSLRGVVADAERLVGGTS